MHINVYPVRYREDRGEVASHFQKIIDHPSTLTSEAPPASSTLQLTASPSMRGLGDHAVGIENKVTIGLVFIN